ncbi:2-dehydropantoate 2-reductase [Cognatishimia sp. SS12]|uniref:ketopantoate reductase family protein n=1 Tax=Cognatishimia sp. SS12 TaxID=2979465 RepID=UPI00232D6C86|nr:2-dehydropantoate 2-reductase [Cognatishimia sp. SS12]MDC0737769.1 2-dehydropantoate 2-reductase [Cognatishimia sp. SS12]
MRIIVHGVGAIGGVVAAALAHSGVAVIGIARGAQLQAIQNAGLTLRAPSGDIHAEFSCVGSPSEIAFAKDDVILLAVKTQDTHQALADLRAAGVAEQPIFCLQNGVENERIALRSFPNVHAATVMMPASYLKPGEVVTYGTPCFGMLDIGRYPGGSDTADEQLAKVLCAANIETFVSDDIMAAKYGKLLMNTVNMVDALLGFGNDFGDFPERLRAEAVAVYQAAGISFNEVKDDPRRQAFLQLTDVDGAPRLGGSTAQSLARGTGSIETDYLNGEIVLLGRLHGVPTPLNTRLMALGTEVSRKGTSAGTMTLAELKDLIDGA